MSFDNKLTAAYNQTIKVDIIRSKIEVIDNNNDEGTLSSYMMRMLLLD